MYKCFGCGKGGNSPIWFLVEKEQLKFPQAVEKLATDFNIPLEYEKETQENALKREQKDLHRDLLFFASNAYQLALTNENPAHPASAYVKSRFTPDDIIKWRIGWTTESWQFMTNVMRERGMVNDATDAGLLSFKQGAHSDFLKTRIVFPITDDNGRVIALSGRVLDDSKPKYINFAETPLFEKSKVLYGFNYARKAISTRKMAWLTEGYTDVIAMHRNGIENTVATLGTSLSDHQCLQLKRLCSKITLLRDSDKAGTNAMFKENGDLEKLLHHGFEVSVCLLPDKHDPDSFLKTLETETPNETKSP